MKVDPKYSTHLRTGIKSEFSLEEIKNLCDDLGIDFEDLGGEGRESKARELIAYCLRRNQLADMVARCEVLRPQFPWRDPDAPIPSPGLFPPPNPFNLENSIVAILSAEGKIAGTGFVVAGPLIVTCAHVVYKMAGPITVRPHTHQQTFLTDVVVISSLQPKAAGQKDVAILRPRTDFPSTLFPLTLAPGLSLTDRPFVTFGYPLVGTIQGVRAKGEARGRVQDETGLSFLQLDSKEVANGMSGAPVVDTASQQVVGMISGGFNLAGSAKLRDLVLAVPTEIVQEFLPGKTIKLPQSQDVADIVKRDMLTIQLKPHKQQRKSKDIWVSVWVSNKTGNKTITECTGHLNSIIRINDDGSETDLRFSGVQLGWSEGTKMGDKSIPAGTEWRLDIARTNLDVDDNKFYLTTQDEGDAYPQERGKYRIRVRINGNIEDESIKPLLFEGYLEYYGKTDLMIYS